jgi:transcriptional adapter 2-alpha
MLQSGIYYVILHFVKLMSSLHELHCTIFQDARAAGCRTSAEADIYLKHKRKREVEENARVVKESSQVGPSSQAGPNAFMPSESVGKEFNSRPVGQATSNSVNDLDMGFYGAELLSESVSMQALSFIS